MDNEDKKLELPDWLPRDLGEEVLDRREKLRNSPIRQKNEKEFAWFKASNDLDDEIERRLLCNPQMKEVWELFKELPENLRLRKMTDFLSSSQLLYTEALARHSNNDSLIEKDSIKALKRKINRQIENLRSSIYEADQLRSLHEKKPQFIEFLGEMEEELIRRLNFSWKDIPARSLILGAASKAVTSVKRRGDKGYIEHVLKKGLPVLFKQILGSPHLRISRIVSLVILDKPIPTDSPELLMREAYKATKNPKRSKKK